MSDGRALVHGTEVAVDDIGSVGARLLSFSGSKAAAFASAHAKGFGGL